MAKITEQFSVQMKICVNRNRSVESTNFPAIPPNKKTVRDEVKPYVDTSIRDLLSQMADKKRTRPNCHDPSEA